MAALILGKKRRSKEEARKTAPLKNCTSRNYATFTTRILGDKKAASLLQESLDEEKETDHKLTTLAESINFKAAAARASDRAKSDHHPAV